MDRKQKEHELEILFNQWKEEKQEWEEARDQNNLADSALENLYVRWRYTWHGYNRLFNELYPPKE